MMTSHQRITSQIAYDYIAHELEVGKDAEQYVVMQSRTDQWNGPALGFKLQSECLLFRSDCNIHVLDTRELRRGWPEQEYPKDKQQLRVQQALEQADYLVQFAETATPLAGWALISAREFVFERQGGKPTTRTLAVYTHE